MFTPRVLMDRKPPFKIQSSPNSVCVQKKLIIIFTRVVNISEKNLRKPVPILREEIRDFKLLRHFKTPRHRDSQPIILPTLRDASRSRSCQCPSNGLSVQTASFVLLGDYCACPSSPTEAKSDMAVPKNHLQ